MSQKIISKELKNIQGLAITCQQAAMALIETKNPLMEKGLLACICPTEFQRARKMVLKCFHDTAANVATMRSASVNPEAIRAAAYLNHLQACCLVCLEENAQSFLPGKQFNCKLERILAEELK